MNWRELIFTSILRVNKLFGDLRVRYPILGCVLLCCMLGLLLHASSAPDPTPGPTLPWPWP